MSFERTKKKSAARRPRWVGVFACLSRDGRTRMVRTIRVKAMLMLLDTVATRTIACKIRALLWYRSVDSSFIMHNSSVVYPFLANTALPIIFFVPVPFLPFSCAIFPRLGLLVFFFFRARPGGMPTKSKCRRRSS